MSTILQSRFESLFIETTKLKLKFPPPDNISGLNSFHKILSNICSSSSSNPKETAVENEKDSIYVHPLPKKSSFSKLSEKSFEMCTENLGSETGSDDTITDSSIFSSLSSSSNNSSPIIREKYSRNRVVRNSRDFPPPLTTISGGSGRNSIQVRPHREDGRLVIRAVETPAARTYLRSERSNGRLVLSLLKDGDDVKFEENVNESENDEIDLVEKNHEDVEEDVDQEFGLGYTHFVDRLIQVEDCKDAFGSMNQNEIDDQELDTIPEVFGICYVDRLTQIEDNGDAFGEIMEENEIDDEEEDMDGNHFETHEVEMGKEKIHQRLPRKRCNQVRHSNKGLYKCETVWVTTS